MRSSKRCVCVCEPTSTRPVAHASRKRRPRDRRGRRRGTRRAAFDEVGREVERRRDAVPHEDRQRDVDEVGGAVVEGDDDRRFWRGSSAGGRGQLARARLPSDEHASAPRPPPSARRSGRGSRSISSADPPPDPVVEEDRRRRRRSGAGGRRPPTRPSRCAGASALDAATAANRLAGRPRARAGPGRTRARCRRSRHSST